MERLVEEVEGKTFEEKSKESILTKGVEVK